MSCSTPPPAGAAPHAPAPLSDYSRIAHAFIELRGKGLSLAAADLEVLRSWRERSIPPVALVELLFAIAQECENEGKGYPLSLRAIDTRVKRSLRDGQFDRFYHERESSREHDTEETLKP
ncbi:MAG: hypothetical protein IOD12_12560 [Silvanigrellales bacterium]|nr:hypothetical protein [Silvanigrellales bacterium]